MRNLATSVTVLSLLLAPFAAAAQSPAECAPTDHVDKYRLLRQLSLDLRGRIATVEELSALDGVDDVTEEMLVAMLGSEDFFREVRRYHHDLLWGTLDGLDRIAHRFRRLQQDPDTGVWYLRASSRHYRNANAGGVPCLDQPARFDGSGRPVYLRTNVTGGEYADQCIRGCNFEGYVMVRPYWDPSTRIKVCALDAQEQNRGTAGGNCLNDSGREDPGCGCGPNLERCYSVGAPGAGDPMMREALVEEPERIFESVVREGRPYFEALTTRETLVNGPLVHYYQHVGGYDVVSRPMMGGLPNVPFTDTETWTRVTRSETHAGVLTTYGYMMRFASDRGRANHFYATFLCQPFEPVAELPPADEPCSQDPDLSQRCGCNSCHATLEPAAAHWGRWRHGEQYGYLATDAFPNRRADCANCTGAGCSDICNDYYVTRPTSARAEYGDLGLLRALQWRTPEERRALELGPRALVERPGNLELMEACTARTLAEHLLHRPLTEDETASWLPELADRFRGAGHDFTALVRTVVEDERYRAIR